MFKCSVVIFRRDYRLNDNLTIKVASEMSDMIVPIFIFTPEQVQHNDYMSQRSLNFLIDSLIELKESLHKYNAHLSIFFGDNIKTMEKLQKQLDFDAVFEMADHTPYAITRSNAILKFCNVYKKKYFAIDDVTLWPMGTCMKKSAYVKFTPFWKFSNGLSPPARPWVSVPKCRWHSKAFANEFKNWKSLAVEKYAENVISGGRQNGLTLIKKLDHLQQYSKTRDFPFLPTSRLSAHLHFGTVSVREVYWRIRDLFGPRHGLLQQLVWREFYMYIIRFKNNDYSKRPVTMKLYNSLTRLWTTKHLDAWKMGKTGCPIVDAGMRQLNKTGWMHNRLRMIVAQFLIFYLRVHWKHGEKYFSQQLVDIDYCNNLGGWLWCSGQEIHSNPWYRIFSMDAQSKRYDPDTKFIKQWCPELEAVSPKHIHQWHLYYSEYDTDYKPLITNLKGRRAETIEMIKKL